MKQLILSLAVASFVLTACESKKEEAVNTETTADSATVAQDSTAFVGDNSRTSVDWAGTYEGTLPCADCEGIKTTLVLNSDETFTLKQDYLGKPTPSVFEEKGQFEWTPDGGTINVKIKDSEAQTYKVGENQLFLLDQEGKEITGALAEMYILKKK